MIRYRAVPTHSRASRQLPKRESAGGGFGNEAVRIRSIAELARVSTPAVRRSRAHQPARNKDTRRDRTECQTARHRYRCLPDSRRTIADLAENIRAPAIRCTRCREATGLPQSRRDRRECQTASDGSGLVIKPTTRSNAELREAIVAPTVSGAGSRDRTRVRQTPRNRPLRPTTVD